MKNFLIIVILLLTGIFSPITYGFSDECLTNDEVITKINQALNQYLTLKSQFKQTDINHKVTYGWFVFDKANNKARIEYNTLPVRIIINNDAIMYQQKELQEKSFTPLLNSPFKYLIAKTLNLNSKELNLLKVAKNNNDYLVTITPADNSTNGTIVFSFNAKNYSLSGWRLIDSNGNQTVITLINPIFSNQKIPGFVFNTHRIKDILFNQL